MAAMKKDLPKIAILFSGVGTNLSYILEHMHKRDFDVVVALTNRSDAGGIAAAESARVPVEIVESKHFSDRECFDQKVVEVLQAYQPELTVLAGFMRILTPVFTDQIRAINLHPSLLPRHKGLHAIERSYADAYPEGGVSIHWVTSELDGGRIILQKRIEKKGLSFEAYEREVKRIEKFALAEGIKKVLNSDVL